MHAALGDPTRLAIIDHLVLSDRSPGELAVELGIGSNLLAHHLESLARAGLVERTASHGDARRRYLRLRPEAFAFAEPSFRVGAARVVFVCTANSARSLLARALWEATSAVPAASGGTEPAARPHPGAVRAGRRAGLDLRAAQPGPVPKARPGDLVVTVCDRAHERLRSRRWRALHWSVPDPVADGDFRAAVARLDERVRRLAPLVTSTN